MYIKNSTGYKSDAWITSFNKEIYTKIYFANLRLVKKHIPVSTAWAKVPWKTRRSFQTKDQQFRLWVYQRTFCQPSRLHCPFWIWQWGRDGQVGTTRKKNKDYTQITWFYKILSAKVMINFTENWLSIAVLMFKHSSVIGTCKDWKRFWKIW